MRRRLTGLGLLLGGVVLVVWWLVFDLQAHRQNTLTGAPQGRQGETLIQEQIGIEFNHDLVTAGLISLLSSSLFFLYWLQIRKDHSAKQSLENALLERTGQMMTELAERLRVEENLRRTEEQFLQLTDNLAQVLVLREISPNRVLYVNRAY
jgi:PAS domain-containing protein